MTARALLTHGYCLAADAHEQGVMKPYPPLGLLYVAAYLRARGVAVDVADPTFAPPAEAAATVVHHGAPVVGVYANMMTRPRVLAIIRRAAEAGKSVVVGGPDPANYPAAYLAHGADVVVFGEGEEGMAEVLPALDKFGPHRLEAVAGIAFRDEAGAVVRTPPRPPIADLDGLPWPARSAVPMAEYLAVWRSHHGAGSVSLITSRGCPYRCRWCSHAVFGYTHRRRSPRAVADEIAHIREAYAPDMLWFADDVFSIDHRWLAAFAKEMRRRDLVLPFETITRADRVTQEVVEAMGDLGCFRVWIGSESGSKRILDAMDRGVTPEQVRWAVRCFHRAGIEVGLFLMWGYDGETHSDIEATIAHVKAADPDLFLTTVAYPIKGTPYFDDVAPRVRPRRPWALGSDRDNGVDGRASNRYYAFASRRLRHEVDVHRLVAGGWPSPGAVWPWARGVVGAAWARLAMAALSSWPR